MTTETEVLLRKCFSCLDYISFKNKDAKDTNLFLKDEVIINLSRDTSKSTNINSKLQHLIFAILQK